MAFRAALSKGTATVLLPTTREEDTAHPLWPMSPASITLGCTAHLSAGTWTLGFLPPDWQQYISPIDKSASLVCRDGR